MGSAPFQSTKTRELQSFELIEIGPEERACADDERHHQAVFQKCAVTDGSEHAHPVTISAWISHAIVSGWDGRVGAVFYGSNLPGKSKECSSVREFAILINGPHGGA